jgi:hypothetical protein
MMRDAASRAELLWYLRFYHVGMIWSAGLVQPLLPSALTFSGPAGRQIKETPPASALHVAATTSPVRARRVPALLGFPTQGAGGVLSFGCRNAMPIMANAEPSVSLLPLPLINPRVKKRARVSVTG